MPRSRNPLRDKAFELWTTSNGQMQLKDIAAELGVSPSQLRNWKAQDVWDNVAQPNVNHCATKPNKGGAPKGNKNAVGNSGGHGGPIGNDHAVKHGFFRRIFPDDDETRELLNEIGVKSPLDILWENIVIQYMAIVRAQRIMWVKDKQDETRVLSKLKGEKIEDRDGNVIAERTLEQEWEYEHAWDKHANFLQAQSRAISTLESLLESYEDMLPKGIKMEKRRLELEKLRAEIDRVKNPEGDDVDDWVTALEAVEQRRLQKRGES